MKVNLDKVMGSLAGLAVVVLPVLVNDHVLKSHLAADLGLALGMFLGGYHVKPGMTLGGSNAVADVVQAVEAVTAPAAQPAFVPQPDPTQPTDMGTPQGS